MVAASSRQSTGTRATDEGRLEGLTRGWETHGTPPSPNPKDATVSRRAALRAALALGAGVGLSRPPSTRIVDAARAAAPAGADLGAVEHVVFLMQENRSFDHYFGCYRGVAGFGDHLAGSLGAFAQSDPANTSSAPVGELLPFHLDSANGHGECTHDIDHSWSTMHSCWNGGAMDRFVAAHSAASVDGPVNGPLTMGYYRRADLPYHYALADAFTLCDHYFHSVLGPTHPNRLMALSGTIDPAGRHGGPVLTTNPSPDIVYSAHWTSVPELLEDAGVSWKTYTTPGEGFIPTDPFAGFGDSILQYFAAYRRPTSALYRRAFLPRFPYDFVADAKAGNLPAVSWIVPPNGFDEHPPAPPLYGARLIDQVLRALLANPRVWASTVLFVTYDESGGFFDHVAPPTPPPGTTGEYLTASPLPAAAAGVAGPIGLGFRVPMLVVSPFARGGLLSSDVFDHTSQIRFLEHRFGIRCPNLSAWRRATVGDLSTTLRTSRRVTATPRLPSTAGYASRVARPDGCVAADVGEYDSTMAPYPRPSVQVMPRQEPGPA
ncbi:MAG TPA: alkaline phosphatase family protein, partial [Acidimicrobiales bacterium]|nr:alkaline phosphatase family protein [Acidimicrobiales bacterium]